MRRRERYSLPHVRNFSQYSWEFAYRLYPYTGDWIETPVHVGAPDLTSYGYTADENYSLIIDEVNPKYSNGKVKPKKLLDMYYSARPCHHRKTMTDLVDQVNLSWKTENKYNRYTYSWALSPSRLLKSLGYTHSNMSDTFRALEPYGRVSGLPEDYLTLANNFDDNLHSFIGMHASAGENIAEPEAIVEAISACISPRKFLKRFVHHVRKHYGDSLNKNKLGHVVKQVSKDASGNYLKYVFGYKPVIQDLMNAFKAHQEVGDRLAFMKAHRGQFVKVHAKQDLTPPHYDDPPLPPNDILKLIALRRENIAIAYMSCEARVRLDMLPLQVFTAYAQYFGLNHIISLAWELIPYSFVVDWVTNIGNYVDSLTQIHWGSPYTQTRNFCFSKKIVDSTEVSLQSGTWSAIGGYEVSCDERVATLSETRYDRSLVFPDEVLLANMSRWKSFQTITSGALLTQRLPWKLLGL